MASYFLLNLDTTPPLLAVGEYAWTRASGRFALPVTTDDPEALVTVTAQFDGSLPYTLDQQAGLFSVSLGPGFRWWQVEIVATAMDPVWNASTIIQSLGTARSTTTAYRAFSRHPMMLSEVLRFEVDLTEDEAVGTAPRAVEKSGTSVSVEENITP